MAGNYAFLTGMMDEDVVVFDVRDPSKPVRIGSANTGGVAWNIVAANNHLYVANGNYGLAIPKLVPELQIVSGSWRWTQGGRLLNFDIECTPQKQLQVQTSTNLMDWSTIRTYTNPSNIFQFIDTQPNVPSKFYRLNQVP